MSNIMQIVLSILAGFIIGAVFTAIKLPIPAPPVFSGVIAIAGVWAGHHTMLFILNRLF